MLSLQSGLFPSGSVLLISSMCANVPPHLILLTLPVSLATYSATNHSFTFLLFYCCNSRWQMWLFCYKKHKQMRLEHKSEILASYCDMKTVNLISLIIFDKEHKLRKFLLRSHIKNNPDW